MRLLICAQAVDKNDPVLGFFNRWVEEFAKHCDEINVIALREGEHQLPQHVHVHGLQARSNVSGEAIYGGRTLTRQARTALKFLKIAWRLRGNYDTVFVHMNQEYVLLAGIMWRLLGKRVYLWRNHYQGDWLTHVAAHLCHKLFCTSTYSYITRFSHTVLMPVGVPLDAFTAVSGVVRDPQRIISLGRIAPSKKVDMLLEALNRLRDTEWNASIYGAPLEEDKPYLERLQTMTRTFGLESRVQFPGSVSQREAPAAYSAHGIFVNCSPSGMYDKTIFEAMACGCIVIASSKDLARDVDPRCIFIENDAEDLARKLDVVLRLSPADRDVLALRLGEVAKRHSLQALGAALAKEMKS